MSDGAPLVVVALGGNAISPRVGDGSFAGERRVIEAAVAEILAVAPRARLLLVHGNGPQVGRLLSTEGAVETDLDVVVAQTQGEIGYLLCEALDRATHGPSSVALLTRVVVDRDDPAFRIPTKRIGPVLPTPPLAGAVGRTPDGRRLATVVASRGPAPWWSSMPCGRSSPAITWWRGAEAGSRWAATAPRGRRARR